MSETTSLPQPADTEKIKSTLHEMFAECHERQPMPGVVRVEEVTLTEDQRRASAAFRGGMHGTLIGLTLKDGVRVLTNGHVLINSFAIVNSDTWPVFRDLFAALGNRWVWRQYEHTATASTEQDIPEQLAAINQWEEGLDELTYIASADYVSFLKNSNGDLVLVSDHYRNFVEDWDFCLDDVVDSKTPITLTHASSLGWGGLLMPVQLLPEKVPAYITALESALSLVKAMPQEETAHE